MMFEAVFCSCDFCLSLALSFGLQRKTSAPSRAEVSRSRAVCHAADVFKCWLLYCGSAGSAVKIFCVPYLEMRGLSGAKRWLRLEAASLRLARVFPLDFQ